MTKILRKIGFWLPLLLLWAIPVGIVMFAYQEAEGSETQALSHELPDTVTVGERDRSFTQKVTLDFSFDEESTAQLGTDGTVTDIFYEPKKKITEGANIVEIDDTTIRAHRGTQPFHRDLSLDDKGKDVTELARYLSTVLGRDILPEYGEKLGDYMEQAIKQYEREIGVEPTGTFQKNYVIYLPDDIQKFGDPAISLGETVTPETELAKPAETVTDVTIKTSEGDFTPGPAPAPYELTAEDLTYEFKDLPLDEKDATTLHKEVLKNDLRLSDGDGDDADLEGEGSDDGENIKTLHNVTFGVQNPTPVGTVPPSAVYANPDGNFCLFQADEKTDGTITTNPIPLENAEAYEGEVSIAAVDAEHVGLEVVRSPHTLTTEQQAECD